MKEIKDHKIYELLKSKYEEVAVDYLIMSADTDCGGIETHKKAVIEAFRILGARCTPGNRCTEGECDCTVKLEPEKMKAVSISMDELLQLPTDDYYDTRPKVNRAYSIPEPTPYWYAFLEPPYGVPYLTSDYIAFNDVLFPNREHCEAYRWNNDFSDYFDAGKEWWGTGLWSVYDSITGSIVVIGASLTD